LIVQDQALKAEKVNDLEQSMLADEQTGDGRYGKMSIERRK